jgi:uncharacterized protein
MDQQMKIAVVGSGISGLSCAHALSKEGHQVSLYEANDYFGGHTHTVDVSVEGKTFGVDTGFLVFNERTYPNLIKLFAELDITTVETDMSFSVKRPLGQRVLEWSGSNLDTVFTQRRNIFSLPFLRMLRDILRFNKQTTELARSPELTQFQISLGDFLDKHQYSKEFREWYLLPMAGCIWSCPTESMMAFPLASFVRFCHNHGLLQVNNRPKWRTVKGGARQYVEKILPLIARTYMNTPVNYVQRGESGEIEVSTDKGTELFDHVVLATHSDQSLKILSDATDAERAVLAAVTYQPNRAVLHTDASVLPTDRKAWAAWNYQSRSAGKSESDVCVHYLINQLQPLPCETPIIVTLNPIDEPAADKVIASYDYAHPFFDAAAVDAQGKLASIQGKRNVWFAGAWTGYGFHEDGLKSGLRVADGILSSIAAQANPTQIKPAPNTVMMEVA